MLKLDYLKSIHKIISALLPNLLQGRDGQNTSKCILIQNTKYPSNKCIKIKYKILVPENVTKYNTCILYLKYRKYFFWFFCFLTIWYSRAFRFGPYNVHKALVNPTKRKNSHRMSVEQQLDWLCIYTVLFKSFRQVWKNAVN